MLNPILLDSICEDVLVLNTEEELSMDSKF